VLFYTGIVYALIQPFAALLVQGRTMTYKEKMLSQGTMFATLPFLLVGVYGLISGRYFLPSKNSAEVAGESALLLSALTVLLAVVVAVPEIIKLSGTDIQRFKKLYLAIQYGCVAALFIALVKTQTA
jgi:hypothetical protein